MAQNSLANHNHIRHLPQAFMLRRLLSLLVAGVLAVAGFVALAAPASASWTSGACARGTGVTVVVGTTIRCFNEPGSNARQAFTGAGHSLRDADRSPGSVCRINGVPANDPCVVTSPANAYWGLFWSDGTSGNWVYSQLGVNSLSIPRGGWVAFVFQNTNNTTNPSMQPVSNRAMFRDVPLNHRSYNHIAWLASSGVTTGHADGTFRPSHNVTRGQIAAFLYRLAGSPAVALPARSPFPDVPPTHSFYREIMWLSSQGITQGYRNGNFGPSDQVLRGQLATFLYRFENSPMYRPPASSPFVDVSTNHIFYRDITWLISSNIASGYVEAGRRLYRPNRPVTREQMAIFLFRLKHR